MVRRGTGARSKAFLTVYYASLYVPAELRTVNAQQVIDADQPMSIIMKIDSRLVSRDSFVSAVRGGFTKVGYASSKVQQYLNMFNGIEIIKGDVFYQNYVPGTGVTVVYKSKKTGQSRTLGTVSGLDFKKAFWGMFLGSNCIDSGLRSGMLGR
nr:chalcone isomerase family protein [Spirochaetota bacterium]